MVHIFRFVYKESATILDFPVSNGVHFHISKPPNSQFNTTYSVKALPTLNGSIGYVFTACDLNMRGSQDIRLKDITKCFKIYNLPCAGGLA